MVREQIFVLELLKLGQKTRLFAGMSPFLLWVIHGFKVFFLVRTHGLYAGRVGVVNVPELLKPVCRILLLAVNSCIVGYDD